jgi:hypothetical protein
VFAFANVMHFLAHELTGLCGWGFAGTFVLACAF